MTEQDHIESQVKILADDPQVWDPPTQDSGGSIRDRQGDRHGLLEKGHQQGNGLGQDRVENQ
jgi:hypothetical protein